MAASEATPSAQVVFSRPDQLLVAALREDDLPVAMALLESAGLSCTDPLIRGSDQSMLLVPQSNVGGLNQVRDWVQKNVSGHALILIPNPITEVATALSDGVRPAQALRDWAQKAGETLGVVRAIGRLRASVFLTDAVRAEPRAFLGALGERLQLALAYRPNETHHGSELEEPQSDAQAQAQPHAIFKMMAENVIWQTASIRMQMTELLASVVPIANGSLTSRPTVEEVLAEYQQAISLAKAAQCVQSGAEHSDIRYQELQKENELLLQQLHHVQEELEGYYLRQVNSVSPEAVKLEGKIKALLNSKSWKITRPLRVILGALTGKKTDL